MKKYDSTSPDGRIVPGPHTRVQCRGCAKWLLDQDVPTKRGPYSGLCHACIAERSSKSGSVPARKKRGAAAAQKLTAEEKQRRAIEHNKKAAAIADAEKLEARRQYNREYYARKKAERIAAEAHAAAEQRTTDTIEKAEQAIERAQAVSAEAVAIAERTDVTLRAADGAEACYRRAVADDALSLLAEDISTALATYAQRVRERGE